MTRRVHATKTVLAAVVAAALLADCASQEQQADDTERSLAAAGFQVRYADTPEKLAKLKALTQRRLIAHPYDGTIRYVYADASGCRCVYAGDQRAYDQYQMSSAHDTVAGPGVMAAEMNEDAAMDWGAWRPWHPYDW